MSELHTWARLLGGEVSGVQVLCPGPGHGPQDRSLSVKMAATNGGFVVHSFSGDDPIVCRDHVRKLLGMEPFKPNGHTAPLSRKRHFDYCGPDGALLYQVEREDLTGGGKKIRQRRPDGNGGWVWNLKGVDPIPYLLPEVLEALAHGRTIAIVEGEAKADLLWSWNVPATCNSGGAGKWRPHHSAYLRGADVVILPDNDQTGRDHAEAVSTSLKEAGATVRILDLPGLGPKGDVIDWAAAGGTVDKLHDLIENEARPCEAATAWAPGEASNGPAKGEAKPAFPLVAWKDIAFDLEEEWRVERVLPLVGIGCLYGGPGSVKTFILLDLFARMARGGFWGGREVRHCSVVYIAAEGGNGIKKRIAAMKKVAAEKDLPADIPFHLIPVAPNLGTGDGDCKKLIADIEATGVTPGAIAIDTTTQALGGADENGAGMDALVVNATAIAAKFQCLVVLVHHTPVSDDDRLRGKTSLLGGLDVSIISKREKGSFVATLTIKKMRDEDETQSFTVNLVRVVLGHTGKGREVSTLVVETVEPSAETDKKPKSGKKLPPCAVNALAALRYAIEEVGQPAPPSNHIPKGRTVVLENQWRNYATVRALKDNPDTARREFVRGCAKLIAEEMIGILDTYIWEA
jgi:hypothetical protein